MTKKKPTVVVQVKPRTRAKNRAQRRKKTTQEMTRLGAALRSLGGLGGGAIGSMVGMGAGGRAAGSALGAAVSRWLGSGDYTVANNSIVSRTTAGVPDMHRSQQSITVRHKEFLGEIKGHTSFVVRNTYPLNPGVSVSFPWLASLAQKFQEYTFKGIVFHYVPTSGHAISSTNAALGTVMIQTSYRATDSAPSSKIEMLNEYCASEGAPSEAFIHPIECNPKENPFQTQYVRSGPIPGSDSRLLYDLGSTYVAVSGQQADDLVIGDLWVTYEVELRKPVLASNTSDSVSSCTASFTAATMTNLFSGGAQSIAGLAINFATNTMTFPLGLTGNYAYELVFVPSTSITTPASVVASTCTNCTQLGTWVSSAEAWVPHSATTVLDACLFGSVNIPDSTKQASVKFKDRKSVV